MLSVDSSWIPRLDPPPGWKSQRRPKNWKIWWNLWAISNFQRKPPRRKPRQRLVHRRSAMLAKSRSVAKWVALQCRTFFISVGRVYSSRSLCRYPRDKGDGLKPFLDFFRSAHPISSLGFFFFIAHILKPALITQRLFFFSSRSSSLLLFLIVHIIPNICVVQLVMWKLVDEIFMKNPANPTANTIIDDCSHRNARDAIRRSLM